MLCTSTKLTPIPAAFVQMRTRLSRSIVISWRIFSFNLSLVLQWNFFKIYTGMTKFFQKLKYPQYFRQKWYVFWVFFFSFLSVSISQQNTFSNLSLFGIHNVDIFIFSRSGKSNMTLSWSENTIISLFSSFDLVLMLLSRQLLMHWDTEISVHLFLKTIP